MRHFITALCFGLALGGMGMTAYIPALAQGNQAQDHAQEKASSIRFMQGMQDVPLAPGLEELSEQSLSFDKPEGRIIEVRAVLVSASRAGVVEYYESVLTQFGWKRIDSPQDGVLFIRNNELLSLSFESIEENEIARFMLSPAM